VSAGEALPALCDDVRVPGAVELLRPAPATESLRGRHTPGVRPAPVGKVWPGPAHHQLDDVGDDSVERHGEAHYETRDCQVHRILRHQEGNHDRRQWDEGDKGPQ